VCFGVYFLVLGRTDEDFVLGFLNVYSYFMDSMALLERLFERFDVDAESFGNGLRKIRQLRVVNVFRIWVREFFQTFAKNEDLGLAFKDAVLNMLEFADER